MRRFIDDSEPWLGGPGQVLNLKGGQAGVHRDGTTAQAPDRQQFGKELQTVAERQEDTVLGRQSERLETGDTTGNLATDLRTIPSASLDRLNQISNS
jgi:hypothetical protein